MGSSRLKRVKLATAIAFDQALIDAGLDRHVARALSARIPILRQRARDRALRLKEVQAMLAPLSGGRDAVSKRKARLSKLSRRARSAGMEIAAIASACAGITGHLPESIEMAARHAQESVDYISSWAMGMGEVLNHSDFPRRPGSTIRSLEQACFVDEVRFFFKERKIDFAETRHGLLSEVLRVLDAKPTADLLNRVLPVDPITHWERHRHAPDLTGYVRLDRPRGASKNSAEKLKS